MKSQQPTDDYLELLHLSWTFLGGAPGSCVVSRSGRHASCPMDGKGNLFTDDTVYMFQDQFVLTAAEKKGVTDISLFVALIYSCYWNEAPVAERAMMPDFLHRYRLTHIELLGMPQQRLSIATFGTSRNI